MLRLPQTGRVLALHTGRGQLSSLRAFFSELRADGGCSLELDGAGRGEVLKWRQQAAATQVFSIWKGGGAQKESLGGLSAASEGQDTCPEQGAGDTPGGALLSSEGTARVPSPVKAGCFQGNEAVFS